MLKQHSDAIYDHRSQMPLLILIDYVFAPTLQIVANCVYLEIVSIVSKWCLLGSSYIIISASANPELYTDLLDSIIAYYSSFGLELLTMSIKDFSLVFRDYSAKI